MNINTFPKIHIIDILKHVTKGKELYCTVYGKLRFSHIRSHNVYPIVCEREDIDKTISPVEFTAKGKLFDLADAECVLFPSQYEKEWGNFHCDYGEPVMYKVTINDKEWKLGTYNNSNEVILDNLFTIKVKYIIPVKYFDFKSRINK